ncbi:MAG: alpha/beta hydrolase [Ktedonobacteraceae bacterium]
MNTKHHMLESRNVRISDLTIHYRVSANTVPANAPSIVMVHGLATSNTYMLPTALELVSSYHIYIPDLPGFGKSTKPAQVFDISQLADTLAQWMQAIGLDRATLLGNSLGCQVIAQFALRYPTCIERAILVGPSMDPQALTARQEFMRWVANIPFEPAHLFPIMIGDFFHTGIRRTVRTLRYGLQDHIHEHLPHVQVPTLIVRGSHDTVVPQRWAEEATNLLPNGKLVVIAGAAHDVNYNSPKQLANVVRGFME